MRDFLNAFLDGMKGIFNVPFFKMLIYGMVLSGVMSFLVGYSQGIISVKNELPYIHFPAPSIWVAIGFISFSFILAIAGYLSSLRLKEDILSPFRKKLVGIWEVRAETWTIHDDSITHEEVVTYCTIGIEDVGQKLILHFEISKSDIFADQSLDITSVMIAFQSEPKKLIYFHDHELQLRKPIVDLAGKAATVRFPFLGVLNINSKNDTVGEMIGIWYDVDNSILNLVKKLPDIEGKEDLLTAIDQGTMTFKGSLSFRRIPTPAAAH